LQLNALASTAHYVEQKMWHTPSFTDNHHLLDYAVSQMQNEGLICEFGVYKGKSINRIAAAVKGTVHGFDSFEGLPEFWRDGYQKGKFATKGVLPQARENVKLHIGWFSDTLPAFVQEYPDDAAFLHIDCDLYLSTKTVFQYFGARIRPGTIIVFDEYFNYPFWEQGEYRALQEFIAETGLDYEYIAYNKHAEQVAIRIR
jgi:hypothetical protein